MALTRTQFEHAIREHGADLRRTLLFLTAGRRQDADDLLQRTFERAWARRDSFTGEAVAPWLAGIARFEYLVYLRSQHRVERLKLAVGLETGLEAPLAGPADGAEVQALARCLDRLGPVERRIVDLYYGREGAEAEAGAGTHTDVEVARILSLELEHPWAHDRVRKRRYRALDQLGQCLERG